MTANNTEKTLDDLGIEEDALTSKIIAIQILPRAERRFIDRLRFEKKLRDMKKKLNDIRKQRENKLAEEYAGDGVIYLGGKKSSWENFFETIFNLDRAISRHDGKSIGNFWAFVQALQDRFKSKTDG